MCRTIAVHFTDPFHVSTRVADKCSDGTLLLQVFTRESKCGSNCLELVSNNYNFVILMYGN